MKKVIIEERTDLADKTFYIKMFYEGGIVGFNATEEAKEVIKQFIDPAIEIVER